MSLKKNANKTSRRPDIKIKFPHSIKKSPVPHLKKKKLKKVPLSEEFLDIICLHFAVNKSRKTGPASIFHVFCVGRDEILIWDKL